jgi:3-phosphoglycerate kinase
MNMEHLLAATNKVVELHNENVQLHTELADAKCKLAKYQNDSGDDLLYNVRRLRSELNDAIKQRDALAEALRKFVGDALFCSHADTATTVSAHRQVDDDGDALTMP